MKTLLAERPLARIPHDELIRLLVANPQRQALASEFMSRYDELIRRTVTNAVYATRKVNARYETIQPLIEDTVSETYYRLFQNDCQVLRSFKCRYENSIFAYLRTITRSVASNQIRKHWRQHAFGHLQSLDESAEKYNGEWADERLTFSHTEKSGSPTAEHNFMEEAVRDNLHLAFRRAKVNRNFIIFKLHFLYGYRSHEIANIKGLGLSEKGIGHTTTQIRQWLQNDNTEVGYAKTKSASVPA